jgi:ubiquitin C-terminal hydrolase
VNKFSFQYAPVGKMSVDYDWRLGLKVGDTLDCFDRGRWYCGTVIERIESAMDPQSSGLNQSPPIMNVIYRIAFRLFPETFPEWEKFKFVWNKTTLEKDSNGKVYFGDQESMDEKIPFYSKRLQKFNTMISSSQTSNFSTSNTASPMDEMSSLFYIDEMVPFNYKGKRNYIIARSTSATPASSSFSFFYSQLLYKFCDVDGYTRIINAIVNADLPTHHELINIIFSILNNSCYLLHKDYLKILSPLLHSNTINYINNMNQNELRNIKKETLDLITKVLRFFLYFEVPVDQIDAEIEKFILNFSLVMLKTNFLEKRISAIRTIVDILRKNIKDFKNIQPHLLKIIEDYKIFYEIYGPNSHIQLIKYSKELLEILAREEKLSEGEIELIWKATRKGDLEGKMTILKILKDISGSLNKIHLKKILDHIYESNIKSGEILIEEINLIYELSIICGNDTQDSSLKKCIDYFLDNLFNLNSFVLNYEAQETGVDYSNLSILKYEKEKITLMVERVVDMTKTNIKYLDYVQQVCYKILVNYKDFDKNLICLQILNKFILTEELKNYLFSKEDDNLKLLQIFIFDFKNYLEYEIEKSGFKEHKFLDHIRNRLNLATNLIQNNLWKESNIQGLNVPNAIDFLYDSLSEHSQLAEREFYNWIKNLITTTKLDNRTEEKLFSLFNEKISRSSKRSMSIEAFESFMKVFLDINSREGKINLKEKFKFEIISGVEPESLRGYENLWNIITSINISEDIITRGVIMLLILHSKNEPNYIMHKCIDFIKFNYEMENKDYIVKILRVLRILIKQIERRGTAGIVSLKSAVRKRIIRLNIQSHFKKGLNYIDHSELIHVYSNITLWDLQMIISRKIKVSHDFFKLFLVKNNSLGKEEFTFLREDDNGTSISELNFEEGDIIKIFNNGIDSSIPQIDLVKNGEVIPELEAIFTFWYNQFSTNGKMTREDCAKFVKEVTCAREEVTPDDHRVSYMFSSFDNINEGFLPRKGFLNFYFDATIRNDKRGAVWENLRNMLIRNDLKHYSEDIFLHNNKKELLPRRLLAQDQDLFNIFMKILENETNNNFSWQVFDFLVSLEINEKISDSLLNSNGEIHFTNMTGYKLVYYMQIIESIIENIDYDLKSDIISVEESEDKDKQLSLSHLNTMYMWIKEFIIRDGFRNLVELLCNTETHVNTPSTKDPNFIIVNQLTRIIRIIYLYGVNDFYTYKYRSLLEDETIAVIIIDTFSNPGLFRKLVKKLFIILTKMLIHTESLNLNYEVIETFRILVEGLICYPPNEEDTQYIDNLITSPSHDDSIMEFDVVFINGLLNEKISIREKISDCLLKMLEVCSKDTKRSDLMMYLFKKTFLSVYGLDNYSQTSNTFVMNKYPRALFDFFANIFNIFYTMKPEGIDVVFPINPKDYLLKIAKSVKDDMENQNNVELNKELLIGYLKILSKISESNLEIKNLLTGLSEDKKYNMLDSIIKKVFFRTPNGIEVLNNIKGLRYVNPDIFNDTKSSRNEDEEVRVAWYNFILSLMKGSLDNIKKFLGINLIENYESRENLMIKSKEDKPQEELSATQVKNLPSSNPKVEGYVGLRNLGCICYMNAVLQQLFMVPSFRSYVLQIDDGLDPEFNEKEKIDDNILHQLQRMFTFLELSEREDYSPLGFCFSFKDWDGLPTNLSIQQDSQEFLSRFFDKLETASRITPYRYLLESTFGGKTCSQVICQEGCGSVSSRYEDFFTLSLELTNMKSIYESLEKYIAPESIDQYSCSTCNTKVTITKRNFISDLPNVLITHFERIFYNYELDRNEKNNSRLEFPRILNMKPYTLEGNSPDISDSDEIYPKHDDYYEYYLVGVVVHIGSADAGHYFSFINTKRDGDDSCMNINREDILNLNNGKENSWLKFNDTKISKWDVKKLEEECFGGKLNESDSTMNLDSVQSAYMAFYERKLKTPMKIAIPNQDVVNTEGVLMVEESQSLKIKKQFNLAYHYNKPENQELEKILFEDKQIFFDANRNEYYYFRPYYEILKNKLIPQKYFLEVIEDNSQFQKVQHISDYNFIKFFENVIKEINETIKDYLSNLNEQDDLSKLDDILYTHMDFILTILSNISNKKEETEKVALLKFATEKLIEIIDYMKLEISLEALNTIFRFYTENRKKLLSCVLNENSVIIEVHLNLIYELINKVNKVDPHILENHLKNRKMSKEMIDNDNDLNCISIAENIIKILKLLLCIFPKVPSKLLGKIYPFYSFFKNIIAISEKIQKYIIEREFLFIMITFLIGRESPHYRDTVEVTDKKVEHWDTGRSNLANYDELLLLILEIYKKHKESSASSFKLSERDLKCLQSMGYLRLLFRTNTKLFSDHICYLSQGDMIFTRQSCIEITRYIDDVAFNDENDLYTTYNAIRKLLLLNDEFQLFRFVTILGFPQLLIEESHMSLSSKFLSSTNKDQNVYSFPLFGFHNMTDFNSKVYEYRGLINYRTTSCFIKKLLMLKSKEKTLIENFLLILNSCIENTSLLKYIRHLPSEEPYYEDFIQWGVTLINSYTKKSENNSYMNILKSIVEKLNTTLPTVINDSNILKSFKGFTGKYLHKDIKREEFSLVFRTDTLFILQINYYCSTCPYNKDVDYSKSISNNYSPTDNKEIDQENNLATSENVIVLDMKVKSKSEREWIRKIISVLLQGKKIVVQNPYKIDRPTFNLIRYVAFNSKNNLFFIYFIFRCPERS